MSFRHTLVIASILLATAVATSDMCLHGGECGDSLMAFSRKHSSQQLSKKEAAVMRHLATSHKPTEGLRLSLQELATDLAADDTNCSENLTEILDLALGETNKMLQGAVDQTGTAQTNVNRFHDNLELCNNNTKSLPNSDNVDAKRSDHAQCRAEQLEIFRTSPDACTNRDVLKDGLEYPGCVYTGDELKRANVTDSCMKELSGWLNESMPLLEDAEDACTAEADDLTLANKTASCKVDQTEFELSYCRWIGTVRSSWDAYETCYRDDSALYANTRALEKKQEAGRKEQYKMATFVKCLLEVIKNNWKNHTDCPIEVNTAELDIKYPTVTKLQKDDIMTGATKHWPCNKTWNNSADGYGENAPWAHLLDPCEDCVFLS